MIETTYILTKAPEIDGTHFVHTITCRALPDQEALELGVFETCAPAFAKAQDLRGPVNACALCCSDCYIKSGDPETPAPETA